MGIAPAHRSQGVACQPPLPLITWQATFFGVASPCCIMTSAEKVACQAWQATLAGYSAGGPGTVPPGPRPGAEALQGRAYGQSRASSNPRPARQGNVLYPKGGTMRTRV